MKINVVIDEEIKAIEVLIRNHEWNEEVQELMECLKERKRPYFVGRKGEMQHVFRAEEIICLFIEQDSIMVRTKQGFSKAFYLYFRFQVKIMNEGIDKEGIEKDRHRGLINRVNWKGASGFYWRVWSEYS
ncbi:hypothetical protein KEH51_07910 [[Brevibacterium] frigoritolerans]|uniref:Uncharacterized protein n=1 Tax=Peribacillus frigoritolerans TaxID=450367 RepID=A0A941J513_9BACI|nr:hypothetical protein [Peribacillus frigoritolerans]